MSRATRWLFPSLHGYRRSWLSGDLIAGLTVWAVLIPEALAYATIAGVSPVVGLYAAPGALLLYAALGSSRHLVTGPMSATAALSAATVGDLVAGGGSAFAAMTAALAVAAGAIALLAGLARLGFLASFISEPVIKGFIVGLALTIIIGQVPKLLGISKGSGDFFEQAWHVLRNLGDTQGLTLAVGLASLAVVLRLRRVAPVVPGRSSPCCSGSPRSSWSRSRTTGSRSSGTSTAACRPSARRTSASTTSARSWRAASE